MATATLRGVAGRPAQSHRLQRTRPLRRYRPVLVALLLATATLDGWASTTTERTFTGLVDIGDGRKLYLDCQGAGSPTVFIIPGKGSYAEVWNVVVTADDPIRSSPYDIINQAKLEPSPTATQPTVAKTTRGCAYTQPPPGRRGSIHARPATPHGAT